MEYLSAHHSQCSFDYCMNDMTRPQLMIMYSKTLIRKFNEKQQDIQSEWNQTANILSMLHNTAMGTKRSKKATEFMPDFDDFETAIGRAKTKKEDYIEKSKKLGLKTPSKREI